MAPKDAYSFFILENYARYSIRLLITPGDKYYRP
jgi:hypothetical protein